MSTKAEALAANKKFFEEIAAVDRHSIVEKIKALEGAIEALEAENNPVPQKMRNDLEHWQEELAKFD